MSTRDILIVRLDNDTVAGVVDRRETRMTSILAELLDLRATRKGYRDALLADTVPLCCCCSSCCGGGEKPE
jgi:hypothetical protein